MCFYIHSERYRQFMGSHDCVFVVLDFSPARLLIFLSLYLFVSASAIVVVSFLTLPVLTCLLYVSQISSMVPAVQFKPFVLYIIYCVV